MSQPDPLHGLRMVRGFLLENLTGLTDAQLLVIPDKCANNIVWNLGHVAVSLEHILYKPSGVESGLPSDWNDLFVMGSSPKNWTAQPDPAGVVTALKAFDERTATLFASNGFADFKPYELFPGMYLDNTATAIGFHVFHEAIHLGVVSMLKKLV